MDNSELYKHIFDDDELYLVDSPEAESNSLQEPKVKYEAKSEVEEKVESVAEEVTPTPVTENNTEEVKADKEPIKFKGANNKSIAILVNYENEEFINAAEEAFLLKILAAVQLSKDDVAIINSQVELTDLQNLNIKTCLVFGENILGDQTSKYQSQIMADINVLFCSNLNTIQSNVEEKKLLWSALQKIFLN